MKDLTVPLFLVIGIVTGACFTLVSIAFTETYESELIGKGQMQALNEVKRMCDGRVGTPNLLLGGDFYLCIENTARNKKRFFK